MRHLIRMNSPGIVKKKARKKTICVSTIYDFCCEWEIVNQLKSFTNSVAKLTHKHIRRDFQFKVFSSFVFFSSFFSVFIVVVVVPVIAVAVVALCKLLLDRQL